LYSKILNNCVKFLNNLYICSPQTESNHKLTDFTTMRNYVFLLFLSIVFHVSYSFSQKLGTSLVKNYRPEQYKAAPENFCALQDKDGIMYFGNVGCVLEYDGVNWRKIAIETDNNVTSLSTDSVGTIYVSAGDEFGLLLCDSVGQLSYISLSKSIDKLLSEKEPTWFEDTTEINVAVGKTFITSTHIYFQTAKVLVYFSNQEMLAIIKNNGKVSSLPQYVLSETSFGNSFAVNNDTVANSEKVFVFQDKKGIMKLQDGKLEELSNAKSFQNDRKIVAILPHKDDQVLICSEKKISYYKPGKGFGELFPRDIPIEISLIHALDLPNAYALATLNQGTILLRKEANYKVPKRIIDRYNKQSGMPTEQITSLYSNTKVDPNFLWMTTPFGITNTKINSPMRRINEADQVKDVILDMMHYKGQIFVRTLGELYSMDKDSTDFNFFKRVENKLPQVSANSKVERVLTYSDWTMMDLLVTMEDENSLKNKVLDNKKVKKSFKKNKILKKVIKKSFVTVKQNRIVLGSSIGLYSSDGLKCEPVVINFKIGKEYSLQEINAPDFGHSINKLYRSKKFPNRLFLGMQKGIAVVSYQSGKWINEGKIDKITENISSIQEDNDGNIWLGIKNQGVILITLPTQKSVEKITKFTAESLGDTLQLFPQNVNIQKFGSQQGIYKMEQNGIYNIDGVMVFSTFKGLRRFNSKTQTFDKDYTFGADYSSGKIRVLEIVYDNSSRYWMINRNQYSTKAVCFEKNNQGAWQNLCNATLSGAIMQTIYPDSLGHVWISGSNGLYIYDSKFSENNNQKFTTLIRKVLVKSDTAYRVAMGGFFRDAAGKLSHVQPTGDLQVFNFREKSFSFEFSSPFFDSEESIQFSYYLESSEGETWSEWTEDYKKEYTNLVYGNYVFHVRSKNIYGQVSKEATYAFEVQTPWFETWWFYLTEISVFIGLIYLAIVLNRKGYKDLAFTSILTMVTVVTIFRVLNIFLITPFINMFAKDIFIVNTILNIAIGAALLPAWTATMRLLQHGTVKKVGDNTMSS